MMYAIEKVRCDLLKQIGRYYMKNRHVFLAVVVLAGLHILEVVAKVAEFVTPKVGIIQENAQSHAGSMLPAQIIYAEHSLPMSIAPTSHAINHSSVHEEEDEEGEGHEKKEVEEIEGFFFNVYEALQYAVIHDDARAVQSFIDQGVSVNTQEDITGESLLHLAVQNNAVNVINVLLNNQANINIIDNKGNTPLHYATQLSNQDIIQLLLEKGANTNIKNHEGKLAVDYADDDNVKKIFSQKQLVLKNGYFNIGSITRK
jgi:hypothetical protein